MLTLHGFPSSNYYNIAKLALLEKGVEFAEALVYTAAGPNYRPDYLDQSPLGKVPCLQTDQGFLTESRVIVDYLEHAYPEPALYPRDKFAAAKMLELTQAIDLYLELPARRLLVNAFSGKPAPERIAAEVTETLQKGAAALQKLAKFDGYLSDDQFTAADIAGVIHFPIVRMISKRVLNIDPLGDIPGLRDYVSRMDERPTVQAIREAQNANFPAFIQHLQANYAKSSYREG